MKRLDPEELAAIDRAGRRCAVCRSGRRWREFTVLRPDGSEPVVLCAACRARYGDAPPAHPAGEPAKAPPDRPAEAAPAARAPAPAPAPTPASAPNARNAPEREDRVSRVLRELPKGEYSTGKIAKAAGVPQAKALRRLRQLAESGEIREVGKRWSTEAPPSDLDEALDRLKARTSNIRIVRDRSLVG